MTDLVASMEVAYDVESTDEQWLLRLLESIRPVLDAGHGVMGFAFDLARPEGIAVAGPVGIDVGETELAAPQRQFDQIGPEEGFRAYVQTPPLVTASESFSFATNEKWRSAFEAASPPGIKDFIALKATSPDGKGVLLGAPLREHTRPTARDRERMARVAAHVATGFRLRRLLTGATANGWENAPNLDAVLTPGGRVEEARAGAKSKEAREALRAAAVAIDRARGPLRRRDQAEAIELWRALVAGRWSLIDQFDRDGRRYYVALKNDETLPEPRVLSERERQVALLAAIGHSNKLIAYTLGLGTSTVATHLQRALVKLGLRSRADLITLSASLAAQFMPKP